MNLQTLFSTASMIALPGWGLLVFFPGWRWTTALIASVLLPAVLAIMYLGLMVAYFNAAPGGFSAFNSLTGVKGLFEVDGLLLAGWIHYLAFDLFIGSWEVRDSRRLGIPHLLVVPCLLGTFMLGPIGLLAYLVLRFAVRRQWTIDEGARMRNLLLELYRRDRVLTIVGVLHLALFVILLAAAAMDDRQLLGVNVWIKPIKFAISIAIYVATIAWILPGAPGPGWAHRVIRWGVTVAMLTEMTFIGVQSARGVASHYNETTPLDAAIFSVMGLMIAFNTCLEALLLALYFRRGALLAPAYLWGIRWGLLLGIFAAAVGGIMVFHGSHTIGAKDGGPGVWFFNWSTTAGDLRIAHALGLHAVQVLPLLGWLLSGRMSTWQSVAVVTVVAIAYSTVACLVLSEALAGRPNLLLNAFAGRG